MRREHCQAEHRTCCSNWLQRRLPVQKVRSSNPSWVQLVTYKIDMYQCLGWHWAFIGFDKNWLAMYHDNVTGVLCGILSHGASELAFWCLFVCFVVVLRPSNI